jgi:MFS transporter, ACS family, glucarate transporter
VKRRYVVLGWFASLAILTYFDRLCISIAGARMQAELGLSPQQWGWIVGIFALSYGALEIPTGAMGDRYGQRSVLTRIVLWWSAFTALTGAMTGFAGLLVVRLLFGAGEAGAFPNMSGALSRWFPAAERARAQGAVWGASRLGGILAPLLVVPLLSQLGWRAMFWILGAAGGVWVLLWRPGYHNWPSEDKRVGAGELAEIGQPTPAQHRIPWGTLFRSRNLWLVIGMYSTYGWGGYFYLSWLHTYLMNGRGLTEREMGLFSSLPFALGTAANLLGGWLSDHLSSRYGLRNGRRLLGTFTLAAASICVVALALTRGKLSGIVLISVGYGFMDLMLPSAWAITLDIGGRYAGAVSGAMNSSAQFGGFVCSVLFGYAAQRFGYHTPLLGIAAMLALSSFLFSRIDASRPIVA